MSSTTLVTFLLQAPLSTLSVNLLGSWDNFKKAYPMQKDSRTGRGHWRGCHSFQNIICDGDSLNTTGSRDGALMMGGKYWYYYQLDDDIEYHNHAEPFTTFCPLLPGQEVNVLDVPIEWKSPENDSRSRSISSAASLICTLNPEDRYLKPGEPPKTELSCRATSTSVSTSKDHGLRKSISNESPLLSAEQPSSPMGSNTSQLSSRASNAEGILADIVTLSLPESSRASFWTAFLPFRGIRSAFTSHGPEVGRKASLGSQWLRPHTSPTVGISRAQGTGCFASASVPCVSNGFEELVSSVSHSALPPGETELASMSVHETGAVLSHDEGFADAAKPDVPALKVPVQDGTSASCSDIADQPQDQLPSSADWRSSGHPTNDHFDIGASLTLALSQLNVSHPHAVNDTQEAKLSARTGQAAAAAQADLDTPTVLPTLPSSATHDMHSGSVNSKLYRSSSSQYTMNDLFSPSPSTASVFTCPMSPYHLSQPGTPSVNDFGEDYPRALDSDLWSSTMPGVEERVLSSTKPHSEPAPVAPHAPPFDNDFKGYSLPMQEQTSSLTLLKPASQGFSASTRLEHKDGKQLVESWNDGSEQRRSGMKELLEELGYLGGMIA